MQFTRSSAQFNKRVNNRIQEKWAWLIPPYAVVMHTGRKSGRQFSTPVVAWTSRVKIFVVLYYGENSDWIRNIQSGDGGRIRRLGRTHSITNPHIVASTDTRELGPLVRFLARPVASVFVADF